jgi:hypothetical protein
MADSFFVHFICSSGWSGTLHSPASASQVLGLQACTTTPGFLIVCYPMEGRRKLRLREVSSLPRSLNKQVPESEFHLASEHCQPLGPTHGTTLPKVEDMALQGVGAVITGSSKSAVVLCCCGLLRYEESSDSDGRCSHGSTLNLSRGLILSLTSHHLLRWDVSHI